MKKKAQAATEYLLVSGAIILVVLPMIYIFYGYSHRSNIEIAQSQVNKAGMDIIDTAEKVYYLGGPSKITLDAIMPDGVVGMEIWENQELVFFLNDGTQIPFKSNVNITSNITCTGRCYYNFSKEMYSPGLKHIVLKANGDNVIISELIERLEDDSGAALPGCPDKDGDKYGDPGSSSCPFGDETDCDDENSSIHPGATEVCNGVDDDCDFSIDKDLSGASCLNQLGVCEGSTEECGGFSGWLACDDDRYFDCNSSYEPIETRCDDGFDNDCDGWTDAADSDCFACILGETRDCTKTQGVCNGSFETCTAGGTWPGCDDSTYSDYNSSYESPPETICDGFDNDCDGSTDEGLTTIYYQDFDSDTYGNLSVIQDACSQPASYVLDNTDCDDSNPNINPGRTEVCDGIDNDCNAGTVDGSGETAPDNSNQYGVCLGSTQSCDTGSWQDDYIGIINYEVPEITCNDGFDNNCDNESDYDSQDGRHGDNSCKVAVTAIAVSDSNPIEDSQIDVTCTVSPVVVDGFNSIFAYIDENSNGVYDAGDSDCGWNLGSGWNADFSEVTFKDCAVGSAGSKQAACGVYSSPTEPFDRSYQDGNDQTTTINVIFSICSARTQSDCAIGGLCEWCYECESSIFGKEDSTKYSGDVSRCVDDGNCVYNCENNECGASCDGSVGCTATECDFLDGCYGGTYRDYSDVPNTCQADCTCTANSCTSYITIITDNDDDGYDIECDNDCNDNDADMFPGNPEICDGKDNDCDVFVDEDLTAQCPEQDGVCFGSFETCTGGTWPGCDYGPNYEDQEATCYDNLDNDCDTLIDCYDIDNCLGKICDEAGTMICTLSPYGDIECTGAYG